MGNTYFQFRQFRVEQDRTAMKVCTDSCIFGAWTDVSACRQILDIGTGTGLLALMLAQRCEAGIDAVEIEDFAAEQARANFAQSPWKDRLKLWHNSIQDFTKITTKKYDLIISNPPFYPNSLKSDKESINLAYHSISLTLTELATAVDQLLSPDGRFAVLLPTYESERMRSVAEQAGLYASELLCIRDHILSQVFREITVFSRLKTDVRKSEFIIKDEGKYSAEFVNLLDEYYLDVKKKF